MTVAVEDSVEIGSILLRVLDTAVPINDPAIVSWIESLDFAAIDHARDQSLAQKVQLGRLTDLEQKLLDDSILLNDLLSLLRVQALRAKKSSARQPTVPCVSVLATPVNTA